MTLAPLLSGLVALCCFGDATDRPPPLTFDEHVDYVAWLNDLNSRGKTENAFPLYATLCPDAQGRGGFPEPQGAAKAQYDVMIPARTWEARDYNFYADYLRRCAPHFETFDKATQVRSFWQPIPPDTKLLWTVQCPLFRASRRISKAIVAQAWMKQERQANKTIDAHRVVLCNASHMQQHGSVIGGLIGISERALVYESVLAALGENILEGNDIARAFKELSEHDPGSPDWVLMMNTECGMQLNVLQFVYPNGKLDNGC